MALTAPSRRVDYAVPKKTPLHSLKILFIGNSFTQRNNLPGLIAEIAAARNFRVNHELISAGGASLRTHWNAERAARAIATGGYDYVVLQEQSTLPVKNAGRMAENIRLFDEVIKKSGAKTVLFMTWARQHTPEAQQVIADAYNSIGRELGAIVVPVGLSLAELSAQTPRTRAPRPRSKPPYARRLVSGRLHIRYVALKAEPGRYRIGPRSPAAEGKNDLATRRLENVRAAAKIEGCPDQR